MHATMARRPARRAAPGLQSRLAAWADHRLLPALVAVLFVGDVGMAANWVAAPPAALTAPAYDVAKQLLPMDAYGLILAVMTGAAAAATLIRGRSWATGWLVGPLLGAMWFFWTVMFGLAPLGRTGASFAGVALSLPLCLLHLLAGLALAHRPTSRPSSTRRD